MTTIQRFCNSKGQTYARITPDGTLIKNEKVKDRLRILDKRGYALDVSLLNEAIEAGATELEIKETTLTGSQRIYRASLTDLRKYSKVVTLAGVTRYAFSLAICNLISGTPEPWQIIEHARWLSSQSETPSAREEQPTQQQAILFDTQELQDLAMSGRWN
jgi:hypothetical protein